MNRRYIVTGSWTDKQTKLPKSTIAEIKEGVGKNGTYAFVDTDSTLQLDESQPIGTIISFSMTREEGNRAGK